MRTITLSVCLLLLYAQTQAEDKTTSPSNEIVAETIVENEDPDIQAKDLEAMLTNDEDDTIEEDISRLFEMSMPKQGSSTCFRRPMLPDVSARGFDVINYWNQIALDTFRSAIEGPPPATRSLAIIHIAMYDAVNSITKKGKAYAIKIPASGSESPVIAASKAAQVTLSALYPQYADVYKKGYFRTLNSVNAATGRRNGADIGRASAKAILSIRANDGFALADDPNYNPDTRITGVYRRTPVPCPDGEKPGNRPGVPRYGQLKPFAIPDARLFVPYPDPKKVPPICDAQVAEVKEIGARYSRVRTPEQTLIALFYFDGNGTSTAAGRFNQMAQSIASSQRLDLHSKAEYFARVNIAIADAAIVTWAIKYIYLVWRPVTAIRDSPCPDLRDPTWSPLIETPAAPSYVSGHSLFVASFARASQDFFGTDNIHFVAPTENSRLPDLSYYSLYGMAEEVGFSRFWAGIHYRIDIVDGLSIGINVGKYASKPFLY